MKPILYGSFLAVLAGLALQLGALQLPSPSGSLARLVKPSQARELAAFFSSMAIVVGAADQISTTAGFRRAQIAAVDILQEADPSLGGLGAINEPIERRLIAAIGIDGQIPDAELTPDMREALERGLEEIAEDFR